MKHRDDRRYTEGAPMATVRRTDLAHDLKVPPQNLDAERGVLGSMLLQNDAVDEVTDVITAEQFYTEPHQRIYSAIRHLHENATKADIVTLAEELLKREELELVGGLPYLQSILAEVPHAAHARYYAQIVRDKWIQRSLIYTCTEILQQSYQPSVDLEELLQSAEHQVFAIRDQQEGAISHEFKDILLDTWSRLYDRMNMDGEISGVRTGFTDFDKQTNGLQGGELVILAARPSMGKTALVCNIAEHVARVERQGCLIFSLEQSKLELAERLLCINSRIDGHKLRGGDISDEEHQRLQVASSELSDIPLFIDDQPGRSVSQMMAITRRMHRRYSLGMVIIDYLQLIEPDDKRIPREQQIAQITRKLKFIAKELDIPVIALAQLNRGVELREDKRPRLADLRESGAIEQDADLVMFLHRPDAYDPEDRPGEAEVIVAKHRSGPTGMVRLTWQKEYMRFANFSNLQEPEVGYFSENNTDGGF
jgi:replicative DNA helicase